MPELKIVQTAISELKPAPYNPRQWSDKAKKDLKKSIEEFGMVDPIIVNGSEERYGVVIGGHFRLFIAKELGYEKVPVVFVNIPDEQKEKELNLRLNKNQGEWDWLLLSGFDADMLKIVGFDSKELDKVFKNHKDEDFDASDEYESISIPTTKPGDMYLLGEHVLLCGDATDPENVARLMHGVKAHMVWTDPPYNVNYEGPMNTHDQKKREGIMNDNLSDDAFQSLLKDSLKNMLDWCDGVFYVCMGSKEIGMLKDTFEGLGGHWQSFIVWVKHTFTLSRADWQNQYEPILYGWNGKNTNHYFFGARDEGNVWEDLQSLKPSVKDGVTSLQIGEYHLEIFGEIEGRVCKKKNCVDIWREKKPSRNSDHPTMKPVPLVMKAIEASSRRGEIVMDLFAGGGSTLIAAEQTARKARCMELDPKYCDVIVRRWEALTGKEAQKVDE